MNENAVRFKKKCIKLFLHLIIDILRTHSNNNKFDLVVHFRCSLVFTIEPEEIPMNSSSIIGFMDQS